MKWQDDRNKGDRREVVKEKKKQRGHQGHGDYRKDRLDVTWRRSHETLILSGGCGRADIPRCQAARDAAGRQRRQSAERHVDGSTAFICVFYKLGLCRWPISSSYPAVNADNVMSRTPPLLPIQKTSSNPTLKLELLSETFADPIN